MDYMDSDLRCPQKAVKLLQSLTPVCEQWTCVFALSHCYVFSRTEIMKYHNILWTLIAQFEKCLILEKLYKIF